MTAKKLAPFASPIPQKTPPAPALVRVDEAAARAFERAGEAPPTERTVAYLPADVAHRLRVTAATERKSLSSAVTEAVREWLDRRPPR